MSGCGSSGPNSLLLAADIGRAVPTSAGGLPLAGPAGAQSGLELRQTAPSAGGRRQGERQPLHQPRQQVRTGAPGISQTEVSRRAQTEINRYGLRSTGTDQGTRDQPDRGQQTSTNGGQQVRIEVNRYAPGHQGSARQSSADEYRRRQQVRTEANRHGPRSTGTNRGRQARAEVNR